MINILFLFINKSGIYCALEGCAVATVGNVLKERQLKVFSGRFIKNDWGYITLI
jgi:hypothetical protein